MPRRARGPKHRRGAPGGCHRDPRDPVARVAVGRPVTQEPLRMTTEDAMAEIKLHILKRSVNNLTARIFVRAAGLDFEEVDVWGQTQSPEFLRANPARLTPMLEEEGVPRTTLWESCAIMQYLCI